MDVYVPSHQWEEEKMKESRDKEKALLEARGGYKII